MKRVSVILALLGCMLPSTGFAGYTINGNLSDWGATPFTDWVPNGSVVYTLPGANIYNAYSYSHGYAFEAMYVDKDSTNLYLGVVSASPLAHGSSNTPIGDIGLDLNGDMTISPHGVVTGLEYAVRLGSDSPGQVVHYPGWTDTSLHLWSDGWQGSPYRANATDGTVTGLATEAVQDYTGLDPLGADTYVLEAAIPWTSLGGYVNQVGVHLTMWCGNDSINIDPFTYTPIPAPGPSCWSASGWGSLVGYAEIGCWRRTKAPAPLLLSSMGVSTIALGQA